MRIALLGPCSPRDIAHLCYELDQKTANETEGYRGMPVSSLANELITLGHDVDVHTISYGQGPGVSLSGPNFTFQSFKFGNKAKFHAFTGYFAVIRKLRKSVFTHDVDVIHAHWTYEFARAAMKTNKPLVITVHDAPWTVARRSKTTFRTARYLLSRIWMRQIQRLVFVSPYLVTKWNSEMKFHGESNVIPNMSTTFSTKTKNLKGENSVLCIADDSRLKNVGKLLVAWTEVEQQIPEARLTLVGPGLDSQGKLAKKSSDFDHTNVVFKGRLSRDEIEDVLTKSSILVHPSLEESQSIVILEALRAGLHVVAGRDSGAVPWTLNNFGTLVDVSNPSEISVALQNILRGQVNTPPAIDAINKYLHRFSPQTIAKQYEKEYIKAIEAFNLLDSQTK